jgi:peptidoglycan/xylan/chitin deacetylase (PgdA/CDA1 family)
MPWKDGYTISDERSLPDAALGWPDGKRCAVHIVVDLSVASGGEGITAADLTCDAATFGLEEGLDLVLEQLAKHALKATIAVPAVLAQIYPERIRALAGRGHEIAAHGLKHEDVSRLRAEDERARLDLTTAILADVFGERPAGWFSLPRQKDAFAGGSISANTVGLLIEGGYSYLGNGLADDIPHYWIADFARRRALVTLPYYYHLDDQFFCLFPRQGTGLENPDVLLRNWRGELDAQYRRGRFFTMTLHPQHIGWSHRLAMLDDFFAYLTSLPGLWNATGRACARHWLERHPPSALALEPSIWRDYPGSLS